VPKSMKIKIISIKEGPIRIKALSSFHKNKS
jgi:hypothetical protein